MAERLEPGPAGPTEAVAATRPTAGTAPPRGGGVAPRSRRRRWDASPPSSRPRRGSGGEPVDGPAWRSAARARAGVRSGPPAARRARLRLWTSAGIVALLALAVLVVPPVVDLDQQLVDLAASNQGPSAAHPFGTDSVGRDLFLRCVYGLRVSFTVGIVAAVVSTVLGTAVGTVAATFGGSTDRLLMRLVDVFASVPHLLLGIFLVAIFRPSLGAVIVSIGLTHWLSTARIVRSEVLSLRERPFVDAAVAGGSSRLRVLRRHLLPNVAPQAGLAAVLIVPHAIWHETALSFLGLGLPSHLASLGNLLNDAQRGLLTGAWWQSLFPGLLLVVAALAIAGLGGVWRDRHSPTRRAELML